MQARKSVEDLESVDNLSNTVSRTVLATLGLINSFGENFRYRKSKNKMKSQFLIFFSFCHGQYQIAIIGVLELFSLMQ